MLRKTLVVSGHGGTKRVPGVTGGRRWLKRRPVAPRNPIREKPMYPFAAPGTTTGIASDAHVEASLREQRELVEGMARLGDIEQHFAESVGVWFSPTDLRLHDHYPCTLAVEEAERKRCPVVAMFCFDIRTLAQPSLLAGFLRASPLRAQYLVDTVASLRAQLRKNGTELFIRVGLPEVEIPRLAAQLACSAVFASTQYAPHEKFVQDRTRATLDARADAAAAAGARSSTDGGGGDSTVRGASSSKCDGPAPRLRTVWNSTLVHIDDLTSHVSETPDRLRVFWDECDAARVRPTAPYDCRDGRMLKRVPTLCDPKFFDIGRAEVGFGERTLAVVGKAGEVRTAATSAAHGRASSTATLLLADAATTNIDDDGQPVTLVPCGRLPELAADLGYAAPFISEDAGSTTFGAGEEFVLEDHIPGWLGQREGLREYTALGQDGSTRVPQIGKTAGKLGVWLAHGSLSPRKLYETLREYSYNKMGQGVTEAAVRELHHRLVRRDYWHYQGVKYGRSFFFPFGPTPETTDNVADPRYDRKIVQRWCAGLTGIPFVDASMREMSNTGWCNVTSRKALMWTLTRGFYQDHRIGAEWMERCLLDYDPFLCYGNAMYESGVVRDRFSDAVRDVKYIANKADGSGAYTKRWLPQLSRVPDFYLHRVHVMTKKMQAMHGVVIGRNYAYPVKLWDGALDTEALPLPSYVDDETVDGVEEGGRRDERVTDDGKSAAAALASGSSSEEGGDENKMLLSSVHLEARRGCNVVNQRFGWKEARRLSLVPLPKADVFPCLSPEAVRAGDGIESGTCLPVPVMTQPSSKEKLKRMLKLLPSS